MFDISFSELLVIGVIALVVIGPERLPRVARTVGHLLGRAQRYVNDVKTDIRREIELDELRKFKEQMDDAARDVQTSLRESEAALRAPAEELRSTLSGLEADTRAAASGAGDTSGRPADSAAAGTLPAAQTGPAAQAPRDAAAPAASPSADAPATEPPSSSTGKAT